MGFIKKRKTLLKNMMEIDKLWIISVLAVLVIGLTINTVFLTIKKNRVFYIEREPVQEEGKEIPVEPEVIEEEAPKIKIERSYIGKSKVYAGDVYDICPYYQPDGVGFKKCLYDLLNEQKIALDEQVNTLVKNLVEKDKQSEIRILFRISEYVRNYKKSWDSYYKNKCEFDSMDSMYGTANSSDIMACEIREIQELSKKISDVDEMYNWDIEW